MANNPVVIEQTAKRYKGLMVAGAAQMGGGVLLAVMAASAESSPMMGFAGLVLLAGVVTWLYARFCAWWKHG
jgi:hypothetical protein